MKQFDEPKKKKVGESREMEEMEVDESDNLVAALDDLEKELEDDENEGSSWEYDMRIDMNEEDVEEHEQRGASLSGANLGEKAKEAFRSRQLQCGAIGG